VSRRRLRIRVTFEPTRRGLEPMRVAYQAALPEQRRAVEEPNPRFREDNTADRDTKAARSR